MAPKGDSKKKLALVYGTLPTVEEIDQFMLINDQFDISVITSESICGYLTQTSNFHNLQCIALADHNDNPTYLPGLEKALGGFDVVVIKERLGMYAYQAIKAKWRHRFRLVVWVDNATAYPGDDIIQMRTIRNEIANSADLFIAQTEAAKQALLVEGVEEARISSYIPFVEGRIQRTAKTRAKALETLGLYDTDFVIAHMGQIEWEENLFDLVHAVKHLQTTDKSLGARLKIVFCGIGSFAGELRERLVSIGLDRQAIYVAPSRNAFEKVMQAADCIYYSTSSARDRLEADPYRIVTAMANQIPLLASRGPLVEEIVGKHRIDFCQGSIAGLAKAIKKSATAKAVVNDVARKNAAVMKELKPKAIREMKSIFNSVLKTTPTIDVSALEHQMQEVESLVLSKQYLAAIDLIESIFQIREIPLHHKSNLYRLIGDCFTKLGDSDSGRTAYTKAIENDQYSPRAYIGLGTVALTKHSYETAVIHFQKAVSLAPDDEMASLGLGLGFQGLREFDESSRWVTKSLEHNPENTAALFTLVQVAHERNKFGEVETAIAKYLTLHPQDYNLAYTLAAIKHKVGKNRDALELVEGIIAVDPYDDRAINLKLQINSSKDSAKVDYSNR
jgi:tetratricopeptide (TPR) repeat protein